MCCKFSLSHLICSDGGARAQVTFLSERGQHNVSYFSLISFNVSWATYTAALNIPIILLSRAVFIAVILTLQKIPLITLVVQLDAALPDSRALLNGLRVCLLFYIGWMPHLWSQSATRMEGGVLSSKNNRYWYDIHLSTTWTVPSSQTLPLELRNSLLANHTQLERK